MLRPKHGRYRHALAKATTSFECYEPLTWSVASRSNATGYVYRRNATFALPLDADWLSFLAETPSVNGTFEASATLPAGTATPIVEVAAHYSQQQHFDALTACRTRSAVEWGLALSVSTPLLLATAQDTQSKPR